MFAVDSDVDFVDEPAWVAPIFAYVNAALTQHPPCSPPAGGRQEALMLLDGPLHLVDANRFPSTHAFLMGRLTRTIEDMERTTVKAGACLWRLYNHGFVVRTPSVTIGMDLAGGWVLEDDAGLPHYYGLEASWRQRLVAQLDLLTVSHHHGDHADPLIRDEALRRDIPVLVAPGIYADMAHPYLRRPMRWSTPGVLNASGIPWSRIHLARDNVLHVLVYPGHQGVEIPNNVYAYRTPEGCTVLHTGDQSGDGDWAWLDRVGDDMEVDVLIVNCWTTDMARLVQGVRPQIVVTGHEMEMSHTPDHRESYWRSFQLFRDQQTPPAYTLCWGERVDFALPSPAVANHARGADRRSVPLA